MIKVLIIMIIIKNISNNDNDKTIHNNAMIKALIITTMIKILVIIFLENTKFKIVWIKITTFFKRRVLIALRSLPS